MKKTLQEQYLLIKEGKGHKDVFIKEAKRLFPNMVRNAATFKEASDVLKSKQIIKENVVEIGSINQLPATEKESYELAFEKFLTEEKKKEYFEEEKAELKKTSKQVEDDLSHIYDAKNPDNINNVIFDQVMTGYYAEMKDPKNKDKTVDQLKAIVLKNLAKNPIYYTEKGQFGDLDLGYTVDAPGLGEPKEPKGPHKSSGYGTLSESANVMRDFPHIKNPSDGHPHWDDLSADEIQKYIDAHPDTLFGRELGLAKFVKDRKEKGEIKENEETQVRKVVKEMIRQELNENVQKRLQAIEEESQYEVLSTKADKIQQEIEMREARMTRLDEDEDMKDLLDKNKIKNLKKEIKVLQKAANKVNKMLDKVNKKNTKSSEPKEEEKEEIVDENVTQKDIQLQKDYNTELSKTKELENLEEDEETDYRRLSHEKKSEEADEMFQKLTHNGHMTYEDALEKVLSEFPDYMRAEKEFVEQHLVSKYDI